MDKLLISKSVFFLVLILTHALDDADGLEPVTTGIAMGVALVSSAIFAGYDTIKCKMYECCNTVQPNFPALETALRQRLFGQHLVLGTVIKGLRGHFKQNNPSKALVLSFHGWTGNGKNFVSRLIAESIYEKGLKSGFVHLYIATLHFPHASRVEQYKDDLRLNIREKVKLCERSLFIFDEMDKMPPGILDALAPFLDYHENIDGLDYRKTTFIFLSNTAGLKINKHAVEQWEKGRRREEITLKEIEDAINLASFNLHGGLWHSRLIEKNLITAFVPFLPMEKRHVKECIRADLKAKNYTRTNDHILDRVLSELQYFPKESELFSTTGCKRVPQKVDYIMEEMEFGGQ